MTPERARIVLWRLVILVALVGAWEWLTGIKAVSRTPGLYWIDPFFISRPSLIVQRFAYLASDQVRLSIWQMALSTVQSTLWGFVVGVSTGFAVGLTWVATRGWPACWSPTSSRSTRCRASLWCR